MPCFSIALATTNNSNIVIKPSLLKPLSASSVEMTFVIKNITKNKNTTKSARLTSNSNNVSITTTMPSTNSISNVIGIFLKKIDYLYDAVFYKKINHLISLPSGLITHMLIFNEFVFNIHQHFIYNRYND